MNTLLLKGKPVSDELCSDLQSRVDALASIGIIPKLAAIFIGDDPASKIYVRNKSRAFKKLNCTSDTYNLSVLRNGHNIQGVAGNLTVSVERAAFSLVYVDATQGWLLTEK